MQHVEEVGHIGPGQARLPVLLAELVDEAAVDHHDVDHVAEPDREDQVGQLLEGRVAVRGALAVDAPEGADHAGHLRRHVGGQVDRDFLRPLFEQPRELEVAEGPLLLVHLVHVLDDFERLHGESRVVSLVRLEVAADHLVRSEYPLEDRLDLLEERVVGEDAARGGLVHQEVFDVALDGFAVGLHGFSVLVARSDLDALDRDRLGLGDGRDAGGLREASAEDGRGVERAFVCGRADLRAVFAAVTEFELIYFAQRFNVLDEFVEDALRERDAVGLPEQRVEEAFEVLFTARLPAACGSR